MITYKTFSLIAGLTVIIFLTILARKSKIHSSHFIWWSPIIFFMLLFTFFPELINFFGNIFGISYPPIIISILGMGLLLIKILLMDIYITKNEIRYKRLAQKTALLEKKLEEQIQFSESNKNTSDLT